MNTIEDTHILGVVLYSMNNVMLVFIITAGSNKDQDVWDVIVVVAIGMNIEKKIVHNSM